MKPNGEQTLQSFRDEELYGSSSLDQQVAIDHFGSNARLLAGPGTGKTETMARRVLALVTRHGVDPKSVLVLTFTRLAARQLREKIGTALGPLQSATPSIATLHGFALRQILHNRNVTSVLPSPIRIADNWEERHVIWEDIKRTLNLARVEEVERLFNGMSAGWETLSAVSVDPRFIGAWQEHRRVFGETLRSELVYQLNLELEQNNEFEMDHPYTHVLVDEFQDLNACDLAVIKSLARTGAEIFAAGDDDQSIYGFRYAFPDGIRNFTEEYAPATDLSLSVCYRCDQEVLRCCTMVADEDPRRLNKVTRVRDGAEMGRVLVWQCRDQYEEAEKIAAECGKLIKADIKAENISILLHSNHHGRLAAPIVNALKANHLPVAVSPSTCPGVSERIEEVLAVLRLSLDGDDSLAMRDLLELEPWGVGEQGRALLYERALKQNARFAEVVRTVASNPKSLPRYGNALVRFIDRLGQRTNDIKSAGCLKDQIKLAVSSCSLQRDIQELVAQHFGLTCSLLDSSASTEDLLHLESGVDITMEQDDLSSGIRILSMHQAKGLSFDACFVPAAEEEFIPGRNGVDAHATDDKRRLLYVSMSRARHQLIISYCNRRTGSQAKLGAQTGRRVHSLTRFLKYLNLPTE